MQQRPPNEAAGPAAVSPPTAAIIAAAWGGALLFVVSLTYFLYAYLVRYGAVTADGPVLRPVAVNVALFSVFALHHSLFARTPLKAWVRRIVPPVLERSLYTWIASVLFLGVCWWWAPVPGELYRLDAPWRWIGVAVQAAGFVLTFIASKAIDVLDLAGVGPVLRARTRTSQAHVPLSTSGVFGLVRHPLYFGWALLVFGTPHMSATRFVLAVVSTAYLALAIPWEEKGLVETFGPAYEAYRRKVRWRMIPGVY
jgi:methanethiol S-methyltransferase